jgi:hypothetical protein
MPLLQNLATDEAVLRIGIFWCGPLIANDRPFFKQRMVVALRVNKLTLYEAGKMVVYVPNDLNFQLRRG